MMPKDNLSPLLSKTENESATLASCAKTSTAPTADSDAANSVVEKPESDMRAIRRVPSSEPKTHKTGTSLAERRSTTQTPLQLDLAHTSAVFSDPHAPSERSQAIDIPTVKKNPRDLTTPLTARAEKSGNFSYFQPSYGSPLRSPSLRPRYYLTPARRDDSTASTMHPDDSSSTGSSTSSPLSGTSISSATSAIPFGPIPVGSLRLHRQRLNQVGRSTSSPASQLGATDPGTPTKAKAPSLGRVLLSPQPHHRQISDAQRKLQQYQRDLIANATRISGPLASGGRLEKPDTPHLKACGSPGMGPATPLMLEDPGDYLSIGLARRNDYFSAGISTTSAGVIDGLSRDLVDQLMLHDESGRGAGMSSSGGSPAVSPAGGPR